ncbi:cyclic nucleotide-binding/CBS domain-containing protein [Geodermatophilus sp. SYSU D00697]
MDDPSDVPAPRTRHSPARAAGADPAAPAGASTARSPGLPVVGELMRPPTTIEPAAHLAAVAYLLAHAHESALVVTADGTSEPLAVVTDAEITRAVADGRDLETTRVSQLLPRRPSTVSTGVDAAEAARLMLSTGVRHLPVVDGRRLVGTVDLADVCRALLASGLVPVAPEAP